MGNFLDILDVIGKIIIVVFFLFLPIWAILIAHWLGKHNRFFTIVREGTARVRTVGESFAGAMMAYTGYTFRRYLFPSDEEVSFTQGEREWAKVEMEIEKREKSDRKFMKLSKQDKEAVVRGDMGKGWKKEDWDEEKVMVWLNEQIGRPDPWDVVRLYEGATFKQNKVLHFLKDLPFIGQLVGGLRWVGIFPGVIHKVHFFRFEWASLEFPKMEDGKFGKEKEIVPQEKETSEVLLRQDVYAVKIKEAPTSEAMPVDMELTLPMAVRNPRKAVFSIEHWLESLTNLLQSTVREYIGTHTYEEIYGEIKGKGGAKSKNGFSKILRTAIRLNTGKFRREYGIKIFDEEDMSLGIFSIKPSRPEDQDLTILRFKAERQAKAIKIRAEAKQKEADVVLKKVAEHGGKEAIEAYLIAGENSKISTLVQRGSGSGTVVGINPQPSPIPPPPPPEPQKQPSKPNPESSTGSD